MRDADPLAAAASRPLAIGASVAVLFVATALTINHPDAIAVPALMILAFLLLGASCVVLIKSSNTLRRTFTMSEHFAVVILSWGASLAAAGAQWPNNQYLRDDWGPYVVAILLVTTSPYRPIASLVVALVGSAIFVGGLAVLQSAAMVTDAPMAAFALIGAAPVTLLAGAGIAYVRAEVNRSTPPGAPRASAAQIGGTPIALTEQERRVMLLTDDVAPLFSWVVSRGEVTAQDIDRAAEISDAVRATMVHAANQTWIGRAVRDAIETAESAPERGSHSAMRSLGRMLAENRVADVMNLSGQMSFEQRTVVRALLGVIFEHDQIRPETFAARVISHDATAQLWIDVSFGLGDYPELTTLAVNESLRPWWAPKLPRVRAQEIRKGLSPFLGIARDGFAAIDFTSSSTEQSVKVTLRFSYGL